MKMTWRCGKCKKIYKDLFGLESVKAVESDTNPKEQHGYVSKCECGYVFHKDKWYEKDTFDIEKDGEKIAKVEVSTVDLELEHFGMWYETLVFLQEIYVEEIQDLDLGCLGSRYRTKEEALEGHNRFIRKLQNGEFKIVPKTYEVVLDGT